ncbi:hypothetical protein Ancab_010995 [Ancistrocladus abbreviatus]
MSSTSRVWIVAASLAAVEALKDQGFCRWNYTIRSVHQHSKSHLRSLAQAKMLSSPSMAVIKDKLREEKLKQSEESLRKMLHKKIGVRDDTSGGGCELRHGQDPRRMLLSRFSPELNGFKIPLSITIVLPNPETHNSIATTNS